MRQTRILIRLTGSPARRSESSGARRREAHTAATVIAHALPARCARRVLAIAVIADLTDTTILRSTGGLTPDPSVDARAAVARRTGHIVACCVCRRWANTACVWSYLRVCAAPSRACAYLCASLYAAERVSSECTCITSVLCDVRLNVAECDRVSVSASGACVHERQEVHLSLCVKQTTATVFFPTLHETQ